MSEITGIVSPKYPLIGSYYKRKGISRDYEKSTNQKPEKAKIFRYTKIEVIKPYKFGLHFKISP